MLSKFIITLTFFTFLILVFPGCTKDTQEVQSKSTQTIDTAGIVFGMGGMRYWTGTSRSTYPDTNSIPITTNHTVNDTFEIVPFTMGSVGILVKDEFLNISRLDTNLKTVSFSYSPPGGMTHFHYAATYYYQTDRIEYLEAQNTGLGGQSTLILHTY